MSPLRRGDQVGQYRVEEEIGHGGMAAVYKAFQPSVERFVALKVLYRNWLVIGISLSGSAVKRHLPRVSRPEHRAYSRRGRVGRDSLYRDALRPRHLTRSASPTAGAAADRTLRARPFADCQCPRLCAFAWCGRSRPKARITSSSNGRSCQPSRLRNRSRGGFHQAHHSRGHDWYPSVYGPGAGARPADRPPR